MSDSLKIYACTGIGDPDNSREYQYWLDNTKTLYNTQAVNTLLAQINCEAIDVLYSNLSDAEVLAKLNRIDLLCTCLFFAQQYSNDTTLLHKAGQVIGQYYYQGVFEFYSFDNSERDKNLDDLIATIGEAINSEIVFKAQPEFTEWWHTTIEERNKVGFNEEQRKIINDTLRKSKVSKVSGTEYDNEDLQKYLVDSARYFLYLYFTPEELAKLPKVFQIKAAKQLQIYNYCKSLYIGIYGSETEMRNVIVSGIKKSCYGESPRAICKKIAAMPRKAKDYGIAGSKEGVGLATEVIVAIIEGLVTLIVGLVTAICSCVRDTNIAKYQAIKQETIDTAPPEDDDFNELDTLANKSNSDISKYLPYILIGGAAILLLKD